MNAPSKTVSKTKRRPAKSGAEPHAAPGSKPRTKATRAAPSRTAWTRDAEDLDASSLFGQRLRSIREARKLSLAEASAATGIPGATLSRIENSKMIPTFGVLLKIMQSFEIDWAAIVDPVRDDRRPKRRSFSSDAAPVSVTAKSGRYTLPHGEAEAFPILPLILEVSATKAEEFGGLVGHHGLEFCYVLDGALNLQFEGDDSRRLRAGESALFDSGLPHAYTAVGKKPVKLLIVSARQPGGPLANTTAALSKLRANGSTS
jgi:transcriptional regulator with XRE-family HTH domain